MIVLATLISRCSELMISYPYFIPWLMGMPAYRDLTKRNVNVKILFIALAANYQTLFFFFFKDTATPEIYTLPLHDALPIPIDEMELYSVTGVGRVEFTPAAYATPTNNSDRGLGTVSSFVPIEPMISVNQTDPANVAVRSEEHTSELQSQSNLVCRLLLEQKK